MNSITEKLIKALPDTVSLADEKEIEFTKTRLYALNLLMSGSIHGGFPDGITMLAGESKSFKTMFSIMMIAAYLEKHPEAVCVFYDTEGSPASYWESFGVDESRVLRYVPSDVGDFQSHIISVFKAFEDEDDAKVIFFMDSLGNLAGTKENADVEEGKVASDMGTRARNIKAAFRVLQSRLLKRKWPMVIVNHIYNTMDLYSQKKMAGGQAAVYMPHNVIYVTAKDIKDGKEILGKEFHLEVKKSRFVREGVSAVVEVPYGGKISRFSGLFSLAHKAGIIQDAGKGWYELSLVDPDTGEVVFSLDGKKRKREIDSKEVWRELVQLPAFDKQLEKEYAIRNDSILED